jgi:hypothetical protein
LENRILVYLDQNIISSIKNGDISLNPSSSNLFWVYSNEHFNEIERSSNPQTFLDTLNSIKAKHLRVNIDNSFRILNTATLNTESSVYDIYFDFLQNQKGYSSSHNIVDPMIAWINGGGSTDLLESVPDEFLKQIIELTSGIKDYGIDMMPIIENTKDEITSVIEIFKEHDHNISTTREKIGVGKGSIGDLQGPNVLKQIWEKINPHLPGITIDQFFAFEPYSIFKQDNNDWPLVVSIAGCCAVLDILGYQAEKKIRKIEQLPNVRSDSGHIAMATFCHLLLSNDKRLRNRANAIYEYKNIPTIVGRFTFD